MAGALEAWSITDRSSVVEGCLARQIVLARRETSLNGYGAGAQYSGDHKEARLHARLVITSAIDIAEEGRT